MSREMMCTDKTIEPIINLGHCPSDSTFSNLFKDVEFFFTSLKKLYNFDLYFHFNTARGRHLGNFKASWVHIGLVEKSPEGETWSPLASELSRKARQIPGIFLEPQCFYLISKGRLSIFSVLQISISNTIYLGRRKIPYQLFPSPSCAKLYSLSPSSAMVLIPLHPHTQTLSSVVYPAGWVLCSDRPESRELTNPWESPWRPSILADKMWQAESKEAQQAGKLTRLLKALTAGWTLLLRRLHRGKNGAARRAKPRNEGETEKHFNQLSQLWTN